MKLKKIYTSFLCYLVVAAFTGVISFEISSSFTGRHHTTELSAGKTEGSANMNFLREEDRDPAHTLSSAFLLPATTPSPSLPQPPASSTGEGQVVPVAMPGTPKDPLFIHLRTLRI